MTRWLAVLLRVATLAALAMVSVLATARADDTNYQVVDGLGVYFGILPAAMVKGHDAPHPEATMHGGVPNGEHVFHILVALFDASGARVENAAVTAKVSGLGHIPYGSVDLEPMQIEGTVTYGNFVSVPAGDQYNFEFSINVPGQAARKAVFTYQHDR